MARRWCLSDTGFAQDAASNSQNYFSFNLLFSLCGFMISSFERNNSSLSLKNGINRGFQELKRIFSSDSLCLKAPSDHQTTGKTGQKASVNQASFATMYHATKLWIRVVSYQRAEQSKTNKNAFLPFFLELEFIKTSRLFKHNSLQIWKLRKLVFILCRLSDNLNIEDISAAPAS